MAGPAITVLGLGNLLYSDDGAGVEAIRLFRRHPGLPAGLRILDGGTLGLSLAPYVAGATHLLVLDAIEAGAAPGSLIRLEGEWLAGMPGSPSAHLLGLADLLAVLRLMEQAPADCVLLGVQPFRLAPGDGLSPPVARALPGLVEAALDQVRRWQGSGAEEHAAP